MEEKRENKKEKILWLIIAALLIALIVQNCSARHVNHKTDDRIKTGPPGAEEFFQSWAWPWQERQEQQKPAGAIGLAVPAAVRADDIGNALIVIKNSGTVPVTPVIKFEGREVYRCSRVLAPGEAVRASVSFGAKPKGEYVFNVVAEPPKGGGIGMSIESKVIL